MHIRRTAAAATATALAAGGLVLAGAGPAGADTVDYRPDRTIKDYQEQDLMAHAMDLANDGTAYVLNKHGWELRVFTPGNTKKPVRVLDHRDITYMSDVAVDGRGTVYLVTPEGEATNTSEVRVFAPGARRPAVRTLVVPGYFLDLGVSQDGHVVVAGPSSVRVYEPGAGGSDEPSQEIAGPGAKLPAEIRDVAFDSRGRTWVAGDDELLVYGAGADGEQPPVATITGSRTKLDSIWDIDLDGKDRVHVSDDHRILAFSPWRYGNVAPLRELGGPKSGLDWGMVGVNARGDMISKRHRTSIGVYRTLFPVRPTAVRSVTVSGKPGAAKRTVRWRKPAYDGGRDVRLYKLVFRKGSKTVKTVTLKPGRRSYKVAKSALRRGKITVTVRAKTAKGWSPKVVKSFRVR